MTTSSRKKSQRADSSASLRTTSATMDGTMSRVRARRFAVAGRLVHQLDRERRPASGWRPGHDLVCAIDLLEAPIVHVAPIEQIQDGASHLDGHGTHVEIERHPRIHASIRRKDGI